MMLTTILLAPRELRKMSGEKAKQERKVTQRSVEAERVFGT